MKQEPTQLDREAAGLFRCMDGMMGGWPCGWPYTRATDAGPAPSWAWDRSEGDADAIDTDDPATVGCMVAQLERHGVVTIVDRMHSLPGEADRRFQVIIARNAAEQETATGPTRGAALVEIGRAHV